MGSAKEFLDNLIGLWELSGEMGDIELRQSVVGRWTLGGRYIELYFKSTLPSQDDQPQYEAVYYIGYNQENDLFVMHLFDTTEILLTNTVGLGKRVGDEISFQFDYETGPFTNRFVWQQVRGSWKFEQTYLEGGQLRKFATKEMVLKN